MRRAGNVLGRWVDLLTATECGRRTSHNRVGERKLGSASLAPRYEPATFPTPPAARARIGGHAPRFFWSSPSCRRRSVRPVMAPRCTGNDPLPRSFPVWRRRLGNWSCHRVLDLTHRPGEPFTVHAKDAAFHGGAEDQLRRCRRQPHRFESLAASVADGLR